MVRARFTLIQAFLAMILAISGVAGVALYVFVSASQRSILESAERLRDAAARRTESRIRGDLDEAGTSLASLERALRLGAARADTPLALEAAAFAEMVNHPRLADVSFTHADPRGYDADGNAILAAEDRWELEVFRATPAPESAVMTRTIERRGEAFVSSLRERAPDGPLDGPVHIEGTAQDPTTHPNPDRPSARPHTRAMFWVCAGFGIGRVLPRSCGLPR